MIDCDDLETAARKSIRKWWADEHPRKDGIIQQAADAARAGLPYGPAILAIVARLEAERDAEEEAGWEEEADAIREEAAEAADPYAYRGLRRSDFI